jgi:hypothetical protein
LYFGLGRGVIGVAKTPNKFEYGKEQIECHLKSDLGAATGGINTDGVRWNVEAKPERTPEFL